MQEVFTLQLSERETATGANTAVVYSKSAIFQLILVRCMCVRTLDGWASDNGAELVDRTRSDLRGFRNTSTPAAGLATWLLRALTSRLQAPLLSSD
jgi:hypothetical protein